MDKKTLTDNKEVVKHYCQIMYGQKGGIFGNWETQEVKQREISEIEFKQGAKMFYFHDIGFSKYELNKTLGEGKHSGEKNRSKQYIIGAYHSKKDFMEKFPGFNTMQTHFTGLIYNEKDEQVSTLLFSDDYIDESKQKGFKRDDTVKGGKLDFEIVSSNLLKYVEEKKVKEQKPKGLKQGNSVEIISTKS